MNRSSQIVSLITEEKQLHIKGDQSIKHNIYNYDYINDVGNLL